MTTTTFDLTIEPATGSLLGQSGLNYLGAFRLPDTASGWAYGYRRPIHFTPAGTLLACGLDLDMKVAELAIPTPGMGAYAELPQATIIQPLVPIHPRIANWASATNDRIGGTLSLDDGRVCVDYHEYYDADGSSTLSHAILDSADLASANVSPLRQLTGVPQAGYVAGWMARVPQEHVAALGSRYVTGLGSVQILARTSYGASLSSFDPAGLASGDVPATPLLYYTQQHPMGPYDGQSAVWNSSATFAGVAVIKGYRSVLFFGSLGTGPVCYGTGAACGDPVRTSNGFHAYPYHYQVWAYDIADFEAVRLGTKQPYEPMPYATWELSLPHPPSEFFLSGVGYDETNNRIYLQQLDAGPNGRPVYHVLGVN